jgi:hypothetical protein
MREVDGERWMKRNRWREVDGWMDGEILMDGWREIEGKKVGWREINREG